jgi:branched-chain amino acid aminotransferase
LIEDELVRAVKGGTGFTKCGGNYAPALLAQTKAESLGCAQVLWLDGATRTKVEEVGTMNCMFKIAGTVYTSPLDGTILPGVTRDSILAILKDWNIPCEERALTVDELLAADESGTLEEVFGVGTAAVISPIGELVYKGRRMAVGGDKTKTGPLSQKIYDELTGIQWGRRPDKFGWTLKV